MKPTNGTPVLLTLDPDDDPDVDDVRLVAVPELDDELGAERVVACPDGCALGGGVRVGTDGLCPELEPPPDGEVDPPPPLDDVVPDDDGPELDGSELDELDGGTEPRGTAV